MPILWRYLIRDFFQISVVCIVAFIAILLTMRLDEIAHFATMGASLSYLTLFILHQIPYILPIALPLSSLIAAIILVQKLSNAHTLTALRASGISLSNILAPLWLMGAFLSIGNFWITSELATQSHLNNTLMKNELRAINPLLLLNNKHIMRMKGCCFETLGSSKQGESSSNVVLAFPNSHHERIHLLVAQQLKTNASLFTGKGLTLISGMQAEQHENFDQLLVENMQESSTQINDLTQLLQKKMTTIHNDHLQFPLLLARLEQQQQLLSKAISNGENKQIIKTLTENRNRSLSEMTKRASIAFAVFSCTFMGTAMGITISRRKKRTPLFLAIGLTTLYLIAFFIGKGFDHRPWTAAAFYFTPHILILGCSLTMLYRVEKGIE